MSGIDHNELQNRLEVIARRLRDIEGARDYTDIINDRLKRGVPVGQVYEKIETETSAAGALALVMRLQRDIALVKRLGA